MVNDIGKSQRMLQVPEPPEVIEVDSIHVSCDGGGGALGHPKVFLKLENGEVECPYCDRKFVLKPGLSVAAGH